MAKIKAHTLALAFAIWSAVIMLIMWVASQMGLYVQAAEQMASLHMFFDLTPVGLIGGMLEAGVLSYLGVQLFALIYNRFASK